MKKTLFVAAILTVAVVALGVAGYAYAQDQYPATPDYPYGPGMMGGFGGHGMMGWGGNFGPMHETMLNTLADALDLTPEELEARHDAGETFWEIAEAEGLSAEEIQELMFSAHDVALEDAVANGWLTEEQAEWMDSHMQQQMLEGGSHCGGRNGQSTNSFRGGMHW